MWVTGKTDHYPLASHVLHRQKNHAGPILGPFLQAPLVLATPEIGVPDDHAGNGCGKSHSLGGREFVIEEIQTSLRRFRATDCLDIRVGEILDR